MSREGPPSPTLFLASSANVPVPSSDQLHDALSPFGRIRAILPRANERRPGWYAFVSFQVARFAQAAKAQLLRERTFLGQPCTIYFARSTALLRVPLPRGRQEQQQAERVLRDTFFPYGPCKIELSRRDPAAYVAYERVEHAEAAVRVLQGTRTGDYFWDIDFEPVPAAHTPRRPPSPRPVRPRSRSPAGLSSAAPSSCADRPTAEPAAFPPAADRLTAEPTAFHRAADRPTTEPPPPAVALHPPTTLMSPIYEDTPPQSPRTPADSPRGEAGARSSPDSPAGAPKTQASAAASSSVLPEDLAPPPWVQGVLVRLEALEKKVSGVNTSTPPAAGPPAPSSAPLDTSSTKNTPEVPPRPTFTPNRDMERSLLCSACRAKALSDVSQEALLLELLQCWYQGAFEPCPSGMPRRLLLESHVNPFLTQIGLCTWDLNHPGWLWFLREVVRLPEDKIKGGRTMIKVQARPRTTNMLAALANFLKKHTESGSIS